MAFRFPNLNAITKGPVEVVGELRRTVEDNMAEIEQRVPVPKLSKMLRGSSNPGIKIPGVTEFFKRVEDVMPIKLSNMLGGKEAGAPSRAPGGIVQLSYE